MEKKYDFYKMNIRKGEYMRYAHLTHFFDEYDYNINRNISSIEGILKFPGYTYPLPTGREGTVLAIALENHQFISAKFLLDNKDELGIRLDQLSHEVGEKKWTNFPEELLLTLSYYNENLDKEYLEKLKDNNPSQYSFEKAKFDEQLAAIKALLQYAQQCVFENNDGATVKQDGNAVTGGKTSTCGGGRQL